jgi:acyl-CoA synthetase (AMP-forming)/AMP-acid ligase II
MNTVRSIIDSRAVTRADDTFLISPETGKQLNYRNLQAYARDIEKNLCALGLVKGDKAAFLMSNGLWTAALFLGIMYSARVTVPLNGVSGNEQLQYVIEHSDAKVIFVEDEYLEKYRPVFDNIPDHILVLPSSRDTGPEWPQCQANLKADPGELKSEDEALLIYTSGTTGRPKGVILTHKAVIAGGNNTALAHQLGADDCALCVLQLYHINGEMVTVMGPLVSGGSVIMPAKFSTGEFWPLIDKWQCSWFSVVPTIIAYLLEQAEREQEIPCNPSDRPLLRFGRSASAPLSPDMHRQFEQQFGVAIVETMGLTETAAQILSNPMPPASPKYGSPGIAIGNEAMIINKQGTEQIRTESGELMIRGDNVMKEYYKNPQATAEALTSNGWLHTGDLAYQDEDGYFFITGRLKEIIIKGGENIAPREIDEALYQHTAVLEAAAFPIPDRNYGQEILACVALKPGASCSAAELEAFCVEKLGKFKAPKSISFMTELPKGPSGKIQRLKLADAAIKDLTQ